MASVYYSSKTNSTLFTTCCRVAIQEDEERCPCCKEVVTPEGSRARHDEAMGQMWGANRVKRWMRSPRAEVM